MQQLVANANTICFRPYLTTVSNGVREHHLPAVLVRADTLPTGLHEWLQRTHTDVDEIRALVPASAVGMTSSDTDIHLKGADALFCAATGTGKHADSGAMREFARRIYDTLQNNPDATASWLSPDTSFKACLLTAVVCNAPPEAQLVPGRVIAPDGLPGPIHCIDLRIFMDALL